MMVLAYFWAAFSVVNLVLLGIMAYQDGELARREVKLHGTKGWLLVIALSVFVGVVGIIGGPISTSLFVIVMTL